MGKINRFDGHAGLGRKAALCPTDSEMQFNDFGLQRFPQTNMSVEGALYFFIVCWNQSWPLIPLNTQLRLSTTEKTLQLT